MTAALRRAVILWSCFALLMIVSLGLAGIGLAKALERTTTYDYFDEALDQAAQAPLLVRWQVGGALDRPFTTADEGEVGRTVTRAWQLYAAALATGNARFLPDGFSGPALQRAQYAVAHSVGDGRDGSGRIGMVVLNQSAKPEFFHADGSLLQIATEALTMRYRLKEDGGLADARLGIDKTVSVLTNESTGWHVYAHELRGIDALPEPELSPPLPRLAGLNYYPAETPWSRFWPAYQSAQTARDFDLIRGLGANSVRIFLPRKEFLDPRLQPANLAALTDLLGLAQARGLEVLPVLFDLRGSYAPNLWSGDDALLRAVLPVLEASPAVRLVDLKNEPDLDYTAEGVGLVQAWMMAMVADARQIAPRLKLTIGFSSAEAAIDMAKVVDVVSYHDYQPADGTAERLAAVRKAAGNKPVMVTEIGRSSFELALGMPSSSAAQARDLASRLSDLDSSDGVFVWTLHDFPKTDPAAVGHSPWNTRVQSHFGLIDSSGKEKLAGSTVRQHFKSYLKVSP